jgi:amidase/formamidase
MNIGSTHAISGKFEAEALSVVSIQFEPISAQTMADVQVNVDNVCDLMDKAVGGFPGVDLIVTVECGLQGFSPDYKDVLIDYDGPEIRQLKDKCKSLDVWGIFCPLFKEYDGNKCTNTCIMINNRGEIVHHYTKMNPWIPSEPTYPGQECPTTPGPKGSRIATIICADGDYPEMWRLAANGGANVIVRISYDMSPWDKAWEITNKAMAYTTQCYVVTANAVGMGEVCSYFGRSMILGPDGNIITEAPMGLPWIIKADLYPAIIDKNREQLVASNFHWTYRHRGASHPDLGGEGAGPQVYKNE